MSLLAIRCSSLLDDARDILLVTFIYEVRVLNVFFKLKYTLDNRYVF